MDVNQSIAGYLNAYAYEDLTIDNTVGGKGFTTAKLFPTGTGVDRDLGRARLILVTVEGGDSRYTVDTTVPVSGGPGHLISAGAVLSFANLNTMKNFRAIREGATNATYRVTYFR